MPESSQLFHNYYHNENDEETEEEHSHFPIGYFLAFCGYTLILLLEKIIFDSHSDGKSHDHGTHVKRNSKQMEQDRVHELKSTLKGPEIKLININNNYNISLDTLEDIKEKNEDNYSEFPGLKKNKNNKFSTALNLPVLENEKINSISNVNLKRNSKRKHTVKEKDHQNIKKLNFENIQTNNMYNDDHSNQFENSQIEEYLDKLHTVEQERKEKKFRQFFTVKGKFTSLAKKKCKL